MQTAQTKQKPKRRFLAKLCLDFMTHILPVEWIFASAKRARVSLPFEIFVVSVYSKYEPTCGCTSHRTRDDWGQRLLLTLRRPLGVLNAVMPRPLRIQRAGARYHLMTRGHRREAIFYHDADRVEFLRTLGQACLKTGCRLPIG